MREIFFLGVGNFGYYCATNLEGKAQVTVIDQDRAKIQRIGPHVSRAVLGDATQKEILAELGVESADAAVVSLGGQIGSSILATLHLASMGVPEIFVKSISDEHSQILKLVGATRIVHPEREAAENLTISLLRADVVDYLRLHEDFGIIEILAPPHFYDKNLIELGLRARYRLTLIAIFPKQGEKVVNPEANRVIKQGDRLILLGEENQIMEFNKTLRER